MTRRQVKRTLDFVTTNESEIMKLESIIIDSAENALLNTMRESVNFAFSEEESAHISNVASLLETQQRCYDLKTLRVLEESAALRVETIASSIAMLITQFVEAQLELETLRVSAEVASDYS